MGSVPSLSTSLASSSLILSDTTTSDLLAASSENIFSRSSLITPNLSNFFSGSEGSK